MDDARSQGTAAHIGGTLVAVILAIVVLAVVSTIAAIAFAALQYYLGDMRFEAALFFGNIVGGIAGVHAARAAANAIVRSYSHKTLFFVITLLCGAGLIGEVIRGLEWESITRLASVVTIGWSSFFVF